MDALLKFGQGSYAYLLILQILVITGLLLALIWLVIQRTREADSIATGTPLPDDAPPPTTVDEHSADYVEAQHIPSDQDIQNEEQVALQTRIDFLEKKLIEYEILQEEIGSLSVLKRENETLKSENLRLNNIIKNPELAAATGDTKAPEATTSTAEATPQASQDATTPPPTAEETAAASPPQIENLLEKIDKLAPESGAPTETPPTTAAPS